ncbi:hypothetical protein Sjap_005760 [Stephania japonica]|uniref:C2H2-type domain-containing protein n=1 Tax=Stephania japonica TaxID=461633 RepID=A0AAP0K4Q7_9MAGN
MVEACDFCGESFHPTYACPYHPRYGNHNSSSYASPQPDFCMSRPSPQSPQQERRTIEDMEKDMISDWLSPSTKKYPFDDLSKLSYQQDTYSSMRNQPSRDIIRFLLETEQDMNLTEQELDEWIEQRDQEAEEEIKSILQKISAETMSAIPLESVEVNEATPIEDYWSEPEEIIEVSLHESDISIAQHEADEAEKEIYVILERSEEPQKESKEDQPLVLVKPPTLPCIFVRPYKGVVVKERVILDEHLRHLEHPLSSTRDRQDVENFNRLRGFDMASKSHRDENGQNVHQRVENDKESSNLTLDHRKSPPLVPLWPHQYGGCLENKLGEEREKRYR